MINEGIVLEHRSMYCTTLTGQIAQIRQLGAELHMEASAEIVQSIHQYMNKFHYIGSKIEDKVKI